MASDIESKETLGSLAGSVSEVVGCIKQCLDDCQDDRLRLDVEREVQRYELWSSSLGVFAKGHASLDYRVEKAPLVEDLVRGLLDSLKRHLKEVLAIFSKSRLPFDQQPGYLNAAAVGSSASIDELDNSYEGENSSSDTDDTGSPEASEDGQAVPQRPELEIRLEFIGGVLDKLFSIAFKIRDPYSRQAAGKDPFRHVGAEVKSRMIGHELRRLVDLFPNSVGDAQSTALLERCAKANAIRRQTFFHWQRQSRHASVEHVQARDATPGRVQEKQSQMTSQQTPATQVRQEQFVNSIPKSTISKITRTPTARGPAENDDAVWPSPPNLPSAGEFSCPYCFYPCPEHYVHPVAWKAHMVRDLRPYSCTYMSCPDGDMLFDSFREWAQHEQSHHEDLVHRETATDSNDASLALAKISQPGYIGKGQGHPTDAAGSRAVRTCPFCKDAYQDLHELQSHIQYHLELIAIFALPRSTGMELESGDAGTSSNIDVFTSRSSRRKEFKDRTSTPSRSPTNSAIRRQTGSLSSDKESRQEERWFCSDCHSGPYSPFQDECYFCKDIGEQTIRRMPLQAPDATQTVQSESGNKSEDSKGLEEKLRLMTEQMKAMEVARAEKETAVERAEMMRQKEANEMAARTAVENAGAAEKTPMTSGADDTTNEDAVLRLKERIEILEHFMKEAKEADERLKKPADVASEPMSDEPAPIRFKDAVGRKFSFPWALCKTWEGMEKLINQALLHVDVIGEHVQQGHYDLIGPNGENILPDAWDTTIRPDWSVTMHMWPLPEEPQDWEEQVISSTASGPFTFRRLRKRRKDRNPI